MTKPIEAHVVRSNGCAVIVPALSISLFFDTLDEKQLAGLRAAWGPIEALFGEHLKWYMTDSMAERRTIGPDVLAHIPSMLEQVAKRRPYYVFRAHGGSDPNCMGPWALDLWVDNPRRIEGKERSLMTAVFGVPDETVNRVANCLRLSFPALDEGSSPQEVEKLAHRLVENVPFLHANAGYALLFDDASPAFEPRHWAALAKLARRHPGYDVLLYTAVRACVYDKIKTVNWLTFLGPGLAQGVQTSRFGECQDQIEVVKKGRNMCIKTGPEPEIGDVNKSDMLAAYRAVARACAEVTCFDPMEFGAAFNDELTQKWVRRFYED